MYRDLDQHHTEGARKVFSKQPQQQLTSPTYNIVNTHMYTQLLTTVTPTNIW
jgi:tRNA A37 threonylcarbamoyladenosine biosynthesis protein TsaE